MKTILLLAKYNNVLTKRLRLKMRVPYLAIVLPLLVVSCAVALAMISTGEMMLENMPFYWLFLVYWYIMVSTMLLTARFSNDAIILPIHLSPFAFSSRFLYGCLLSGLMIDMKSLFFLLPFSILATGIMIRSFTAGFLSIPIILLIFLLIEIWTLNIYLLFYRIMEVHKKNLPIVSSILFILYVFGFAEASSIKRLVHMHALPWIEAPVVGGMNSSSWTVVQCSFFLFLLASAGMVLGIMLSSRREIA